VINALDCIGISGAQGHRKFMLRRSVAARRFRGRFRDCRPT
jgi:hypothetical protein